MRDGQSPGDERFELARVGAESARVLAIALARPIALLAASGDRVTVLAACDATGSATASGTGLSLEAMPPGFRAALQAGSASVIALEGGRPALGDWMAGEAPGAWAVAPLFAGGARFGVLAVALRRADELSAEDVRLLETAGRVAGLALSEAMRQSELDRLNRRLQDGVDLALAAGRSLRPADVADTALGRMADSVGAHRGALARIEPDGLLVDSIYRSGADGGLARIDRAFPLDLIDSIPCLANAVRSGQPVIGAGGDASRCGSELASLLAFDHHTLVLPLAVADDTTCVIVLSRNEGSPFREADVAGLRPMADIALLALRNAYLYASTERAQETASRYLRRLELAIEAAEDIGSSPELTEVLDRVLRRAVAVAHADRGSISRWDGDSMVVEHYHDPDVSDLPVGVRWNLTDSALAAEAVRTHRPAWGASSSGAPTSMVARWLERRGQRHTLSCPLMVGREVVGLLGLSRRGDGFSEGEVLTLQPFASLAGLLLRNARLLEEARQVGEAKSAFLNLAAHELRTPLTVIKGYLSMMEDGTFPVPDRTRDEAITILIAKARELETLVESLLTSARLEVGSLPRTPVEFDIAEVVREARIRIEPRARLEEARIAVQIQCQHVLARADRDHVDRILDNLLNNALSYSPPPADVTVTVRPSDFIEVAVRDRGLGIPADQRNRVFERFYRLDASSTTFSPGLGLGLSISRDLAEMNGGSLVIEESEPGRGSVFVLRLPSANGGLPPSLR